MPSFHVSCTIHPFSFLNPCMHVSVGERERERERLFWMVCNVIWCIGEESCTFSHRERQQWQQHLQLQQLFCHKPFLPGEKIKKRPSNLTLIHFSEIFASIPILGFVLFSFCPIGIALNSHFLCFTYRFCQWVLKIRPWSCPHCMFIAGFCVRREGWEKDIQGEW